MLVLSRKLGEKIVIGDSIVVTVVKIDRAQIRIGVEAPHEMPVYREEISPRSHEGIIPRSHSNRPRSKFTDWSIRYHATEPNGEHVRLGVAELHSAFPGATITVEQAGSDGDVLDIRPPSGASIEDEKSSKKHALIALGRIFKRYLPYHGWTIRYQTGQAKAVPVQRRHYALSRRFPGARICVEHSDSALDRLVIEHVGEVNSEEKLTAFELARKAIEDATVARIEELRRADPALLRLLFHDALAPMASRDNSF